MLMLYFIKTKNTNIFFELQNYFIDNLGRFCYYNYYTVFRLKKVVFQGSTLGY